MMSESGTVEVSKVKRARPEVTVFGKFTNTQLEKKKKKKNIQGMQSKIKHKFPEHTS